MKNKYYFAKNLKYLRAKKGVEQQEIAEKLGRKSGSAVSEWEKGLRIPDVGTLDIIAAYFGINIDDLMKKDLQNPEPEIKTVAAHAMEDLTEEEQAKVLEFIKFQKMQRKDD